VSNARKPAPSEVVSFRLLREILVPLKEEAALKRMSVGELARLKLIDQQNGAEGTVHAERLREQVAELRVELAEQRAELRTLRVEAVESRRIFWAAVKTILKNCSDGRLTRQQIDEWAEQVLGQDAA
jgi:hypothetical protein